MKCQRQDLKKWNELYMVIEALAQNTRNIFSEGQNDEALTPGSP